MKKSPIIIASAVVAMLAIAGCSGPADNAAGQSGTTASESAPAQSGVAPFTATAPGNGAGQVNDPAQVNGVQTGAATGVSAAADSSKRLITVQGTGSVTGTPDVLTITLGVQTTSGSAQSAIDENNRLSTDTIAVIKGGGVADADLQTSQLTVNPTYDDKGAITGYQVSNLLTAKLRNIAGAGALIDGVGKAAGNAVRVQQLSFSIDNDSDLRSAARTDAVRQAQTQAKELADAAGVALGPVDSITETAGSSPVTYQPPMLPDAAAGVPIQAGSQELNVVVQVVYQIG